VMVWDSSYYLLAVLSAQRPCFVVDGLDTSIF